MSGFWRELEWGDITTKAQHSHSTIEQRRTALGERDVVVLERLLECVAREQLQQNTHVENGVLCAKYAVLTHALKTQNFVVAFHVFAASNSFANQVVGGQQLLQTSSRSRGFDGCRGKSGILG